jgi:GDP-L-fucose synthase
MTVKREREREKMKILVTGGTGLVGTAIKTVISGWTTNKDKEFIFLSSSDLDLRDGEATLALFQYHQPDVILHLAAVVGGLFKNMREKVRMLEENIMINMNVLSVAHACDVNRVISCLSTCIFPDKTSYPIDETMLHDGPPHISNDAYAYAKRMLEVQSRAYREQYGRDYVCVIPTNIYGPADNFHLGDAHVIPALIHKCFLARNESLPFIVAGSGMPLRQFIYSEDLATLLIWMLDYYIDQKEPLILSVDPSDEVSILYIAQLIAAEFQYENKLVMDTSLPDGQYKKTASNARLRSFLPSFLFTSIEEGIKKTVTWFLAHYPTCRK